MADKFQAAANGLVEELTAQAKGTGWRRKRWAVGETEGGAGQVTMVFVQALEGDATLSGTPMGGAVNGHRTPEEQADYDAVAGEVRRVDEDRFGGFAAPRAYRPGSEEER